MLLLLVGELFGLHTMRQNLDARGEAIGEYFAKYFSGQVHSAVYGLHITLHDNSIRA